MANKEIIDKLSEEDLNEVLNKEEDYTADCDNDDCDDEFDAPIVYKDEYEPIKVAKETKSAYPYEMDNLTPRQRDKAAKKIKKQREKLIKKHRKALKKNPSRLVRYNPDIEVGLTKEIVESRIIDGLVNETKGKSSKSIPKIIFSNIFTFFNVLIFLIAACLILVGAYTDLVFLLIVSCNIIIGIIQEIRAKNMIDKLSLMSAPTAIVKRNGHNQEIYVNEVVLDDLLLLENGRQICADSIVVDGTVEVNESLLTGESDPIVKHVGDMLLSGSFIVSGRCTARVDKVGKDNYIEELSSQAKKYKKPKSDLLFSLNLIVKVMSFPVVLI